VIALLLGWILSLASDAEALRRTAPAYLSYAAAVEHVAAADLAGLAFDVDPVLLLSISHHESRYRHDTITPERGGKFSCGAMTPIPTYDRAACARARASVLASYLAGARHLREWLDTPRCRGGTGCASLGYAGGYRLIKRCARGPVVRKRGAAQRDICRTPEVFEHRAALIRRERARARTGAGV